MHFWGLRCYLKGRDFPEHWISLKDEMLTKCRRIMFVSERKFQTKWSGSLKKILKKCIGVCTLLHFSRQGRVAQ